MSQCFGSGCLKPSASSNNLHCEKALCRITTNKSTNTNIEKLADVAGDEITCCAPHSTSSDGTFNLLSISPLPLLALAALPGGNTTGNMILFLVVFIFVLHLQILCYFL